MRYSRALRYQLFFLNEYLKYVLQLAPILTLSNPPHIVPLTAQFL